MLTKEQKKLFEDVIYNILSESLTESESSNKKGTRQGRRESVMKWLDNNLTNHAAIAYKLYKTKMGDEVEEGNARSLFTKKYKGRDSSGKPYSFDDSEITTLYNMKDSYSDI